MSKATEEYNLGVINPNLAKEWHPTRNQNLNPRTVTPGSSKRVWWICGNGHEWQAPIYLRNRGSSCPVCRRSAAVSDKDTLISNKALLKEWHLSRNRGLNIRNLPSGFHRKVWWLCKEGHEWKATVQSRMKGSGCPICNKVVTPKKTYLGTDSPSWEDHLAQTALTQLSEATGFRKSMRFFHRATVILEEANSGALSYAQTKNLSNDGMLLESEIAFKPGTVINIQFETQPFKTAPKNYRSVVKWCRELVEENAISTYGIGVKFF
jgi:hypothetical protein